MKKYTISFYSTETIIDVEASTAEEAYEKARCEWLQRNTPPLVEKVVCTSNCNKR